jgi:hypothetical protein
LSPSIGKTTGKLHSSSHSVTRARWKPQSSSFLGDSKGCTARKTGRLRRNCSDRRTRHRHHICKSGQASGRADLGHSLHTRHPQPVMVVTNGNECRRRTNVTQLCGYGTLAATEELCHGDGNGTRALPRRRSRNDRAASPALRTLPLPPHRTYPRARRVRTHAPHAPQIAARERPRHRRSSSTHARTNSHASADAFKPSPMQPVSTSTSRAIATLGAR